MTVLPSYSIIPTNIFSRHDIYSFDCKDTPYSFYINTRKLKSCIGKERFNKLLPMEADVDSVGEVEKTAWRGGFLWFVNAGSDI